MNIYERIKWMRDSLNRDLHENENKTMRLLSEKLVDKYFAKMKHQILKAFIFMLTESWGAMGDHGGKGMQGLTHGKCEEKFHLDAGFDEAGSGKIWFVWSRTNSVRRREMELVTHVDFSPWSHPRSDFLNTCSHDIWAQFHSHPSNAYSCPRDGKSKIKIILWARERFSASDHVILVNRIEHKKLELYSIFGVFWF